MTLKRTLVGAVAVVATLGVAGCGSAADISGAQGASLNRSGFAAAVTDATQQMHSVHVSGTFTVQGQHVAMTGDSAFGDQTLTGASGAFRVTLPSMGTLEARLVGGVLYVNAARLGLGQVGGKPWLKVDLSDPSNPLGAMFGKITDNLGPGQLLTTLKSLSTVRSLGDETVDGVAATHYRLTVDTAKLGSALGLDQSQLGQHASLPKTVSYDVWVDASARPVKVSLTTSAGAMELHFSRWNEPVHVQAPPASQVSTFSF
jgi:LppX/LprAFG-like lipoprotein